MIVFYLFISMMCITIILLLSSVIVDIKSIQIDNINKLKEIFLSIENKRYDKIFDYINIEVNIKLEIFNVLPVLIIKINNQSMKKIIKKTMIKDLKDRKHNEFKFRLKRKKQKEQIIQLQKRINPKIKIEDADLKINIGLTNAGVTAIVTGIINILISILVFELVSEKINDKEYNDKNSKLINTMQSLNYTVKPIYSEDFAFNLKSKLKLRFPISSFI